MVHENADVAQHHSHRKKACVNAGGDRVRHLFATQDYPPDLGGMARRHVELCRRFADARTNIEVSTVRSDIARTFDAGEPYEIQRQPFYFSEAKRFTNQVRWARWLLSAELRNVGIIHCGNLRPVGYAVALAHLRRRTPFLVYVNGSDLLREQQTLDNARKKFGARRILGAASGIVATSEWVGRLASELLEQLQIRKAPPIGAFDLGTDPVFFNPAKNTGRLRAAWRIGQSPLLLTVARLIPHKGQDVTIRAVAALGQEFPTLRYAIVGVGPDETRLRSLAEELGVADKVIFAGALTDEAVAEAYATATVYVGLSRVESVIYAEGFGISFL
ncbi:MAG TPA: glycosyltransferase family 4 protein, partial [Gemmatimonadaceae bacterium]|nr:glycosyltransferase family 4 protein [Gemmatimonadaceae bacterium]